MNGRFKEVKFVFTDVAADGSPLDDPWQIYLRIVGRFEVYVGQRIFYTEESFCLVEFAVESQLWLKNVRETHEEFVYTSQEAEEYGLFRIQKSGANWRIGSSYQEYEELKEFSLEMLNACLSEYYARLSAFIGSEFGKDLLAVVAWAEANKSR